MKDLDESNGKEGNDENRKVDTNVDLQDDVGKIDMESDKEEVNKIEGQTTRKAPSADKNGQIELQEIVEKKKQDNDISSQKKRYDDKNEVKKENLDQGCQELISPFSDIDRNVKKNTKIELKDNVENTFEMKTPKEGVNKRENGEETQRNAPIKENNEIMELQEIVEKKKEENGISNPKKKNDSTNEEKNNTGLPANENSDPGCQQPILSVLDIHRNVKENTKIELKDDVDTETPKEEENTREIGEGTKRKPSIDEKSLEIKFKEID